MNNIQTTLEIRNNDICLVFNLPYNPSYKRLYMTMLPLLPPVATTKTTIKSRAYEYERVLASNKKNLRHYALILKILGDI